MARTLCILMTAMMTLLLAGPGSALHCNGDITTIVTPATSFYIDDRSDGVGEINHWLYMEGNGIAGLQTGGGTLVQPCEVDHQLFCFGDPCQHANPDRLLL